MSAVVAVERGNSVTPPKLTGDAPVLRIFHPVEVVFVESFGNEFYSAVANALYGGLCERLHLNEPLEGNHRLDCSSAAVARAYFMLEVFNLAEVSAGFEVFNDGFARFVSVHSGVLRVVVRDFRVGSKAYFHGEVLSSADFKVVRVVSGSDFNAACTLVKLSVLVAYYRNASSNERKSYVFADEVLISFVVRVYRNRSISEQCFRTCGSNLNESAAAYERITDVPEVAVLLAVVNLGVGDGCFAVRTPVDDSLAAIDESLFVKAVEHLANCLGAAFVKGESFSRPVAG